jgi:LAO/AO transport system ATPase
MLEELLERYRHGERRALARLISHAARGEAIAELARGLPVVPTPSRVIAFTGGGGVGKSTLIGRMIELARGGACKVAVLACDPQSPLSGGALLGDRFRMGDAADDSVFIRSLAAHGSHGAVAEHLDLIVRLLEGFGFDTIFVETVGAGQGDVAVAALADVVVLLLQPETGDDLQWEKAGILELADAIVVHKADLPGAEQTAAQVRRTLELSPGRSVPVFLVSTKKNQGHWELWDAIRSLPPRRRLPSSVELLRRAQDLLAERLRLAEGRGDPQLIQLLQDLRRVDSPVDEAAQRLLRMLAVEQDH